MNNFKKAFSSITIFGLILLILSTGCGNAGIEEFEIALETNPEAQLSPDQSINLQNSLIVLSDLYLKATIATNTALSSTPENTSYEDWRAKTEESLKAWGKLEEALKHLENIKLDIETNKNNPVTGYLSRPLKTNLVAFAAAPDPALVTAVFDSNPNNTNSLKNLMDFFGWDAKTALKQLKIAQDQIEADSWNEEGDAWEMAQNQSKIILDSMKVSLMIGGMIVTAGATTPLVAGSAGSIFAKGALILEGTDLAMAIGEDAMIAFGNEDGEAIISQKRDKISTPCKIVSIAKLLDVSDPGNLITITELGTEYGPKVFDWMGGETRVSLDPTGAKMKFTKSNLTGDLPAFDPEDIDRFRLNAKKAWEEMGIPEMIVEAEENMKEQKKLVDREIDDLNDELDEYLKQKLQLEHNLEILKSMQGGTFTQVDPEAMEKLSKQLTEINKKINALKDEIKQKENLSESLDLIGDNNDDDEKAEYPETLYAKGTWTSSHGESGEISIDFPSAGGSFSGGFSGCPNNVCWNSTVSGTFDGNDPGKISGTVKGSVAATEYTPTFNISGNFSGDISLKDGTVNGTFSNSLTDTSGQYGTYTDGGSWYATFDNGL